MTDKLVMQSIGADGDWYEPWLELSRPIHEQYAAACGADYELFAGTKDPRVHPAWNRIVMFLNAFSAGYRKILWLDADTLVVDQSVDIFAETDDSTPWQMIRAKDTHVEMPWGVPGWDLYNDGVLIANATPETVEAFRWVWDQRHQKPRSHHIPALWELSWINDWCLAHPEDVAEIQFRFNWMPFDYACPKSEAVILGYHGMPHDQRLALFHSDLAETYGVLACD